MSKLLLDMDGVPVDFVRGVLKKFGVKTPYEDIRWNFLDTVPGAWEQMDRQFWRDLDWTPYGQELYAKLLKRFGAERMMIMSSPCDTAGCMDGKLDWIRRHMPELKRRFLFGPAKDIGAGVLLDDRNENVDLFKKAGGFGVLFPQPWNHYGYECNDIDRIVDAVSNFMD